MDQLEFGEVLVLAIPRVIANIMRDIPYAFSMQPNNIFRKDISDTRCCH